MGRSTVQQLIQRAQSMNSYNNSGIDSKVAWVDFFNEALTNMVDHLEIQETIQIQYDPQTKEYALPDDYYGLISVTDDRGIHLKQRRSYQQPNAYGWYVLDKGSHHVLDVTYDFLKPLSIHYYRYPAFLVLGDVNTQKPEVPTAGETALCYKAIYFALLNNNQTAPAQYYEQLFKKELATIKTAADRARGN